MEVPVTVIKRYPKFLSIPVPVKSKRVKLDINWLSYQELKEGLCKVKSDYIICFFHSSSFILRDESLTGVKDINDRDLQKFIRLMSFIQDNTCDVIGFDPVIRRGI